VAHDHAGEFAGQKRSLLLTIGLNLGFAIAEGIAGFFANSLALMSDAVHDLSDAAALGLSYLGVRLAEQRPTGRRTFGFRKVRILAAFINALVLIALTAFIMRAAILRLLQPQEVRSPILIALAIIGLLVNGFAVLVLRRHRGSLNIRAAMWHLLEDFLGWVLVLAGGIVIRYTGWYVIDPILSILLGLFVIYGAYTVFREATRILIDSTPEDLSFATVGNYIRSYDPAIRDLHDLHIWTIGEGERALMCHLVVTDGSVSSVHPLLAKLECDLHEKFEITHVTLELECENCKSGDNVCRH
jgi:cobalt-zinc-cadmium efflux system protein